MLFWIMTQSFKSTAQNIFVIANQTKSRYSDMAFKAPDNLKPNQFSLPPGQLLPLGANLRWQIICCSCPTWGDLTACCFPSLHIHATFSCVKWLTFSVSVMRVSFTLSLANTFFILCSLDMNGLVCAFTSHSVAHAAVGSCQRSFQGRGLAALLNSSQQSSHHAE